jgi:Polysaccharide deacetylase
VVRYWKKGGDAGVQMRRTRGPIGELPVIGRDLRRNRFALMSSLQYTQPLLTHSPEASKKICRKRGCRESSIMSGSWSAHPTSGDPNPPPLMKTLRGSHFVPKPAAPLPSSQMSQTDRRREIAGLGFRRRRCGDVSVAAVGPHCLGHRVCTVLPATSSWCKIHICWSRGFNVITQIRNNGRNSESVSSPERRLATYPHRPHPEFTPPLLDILEKYRAHETFFMLGEAVHQYPELVRRGCTGRSRDRLSLLGSLIGSFHQPARAARADRGRRAGHSLRGQRLFRPPTVSRMSCHASILSGSAKRLSDGIWRSETGGIMIPVDG